MKLAKRMDEQIAPISFTVVFHSVVHLLGIFIILMWPYSWKLGSFSQSVTAPPFALILWISICSIVWTSLRLFACRPVKSPLLILILIPICISAGTIKYANTVMKCTDAGYEMLEEDLRLVTERIQELKDQPHRAMWEIEYRDQLVEELR
jgi:hypothetical protein